MAADLSHNPPRTHQPGVVWFTGLSGSGKSTIAEGVVQACSAQGSAVEYLDGDRVRAMFPNTGFTRAERDEHIRRIGFVAHLLEKHGVLVICSFVSPYRAARDAVRAMCSRFFEVYVATPLEECERRDVKGLYARARCGEIQNFTGINDPYEPPLRPELTLDTTALTVPDAVAAVLQRIGAPGNADHPPG
jgi:adenylylsulfate kinase